MLTPHTLQRTRRTPRARPAFSLVLSLTVMAMLLLLCLSIAALLALELRVGRASLSRTKARMNAMVGAKIALGEIQRTLGPDQRVSATADILCDAADLTKTNPAQADYYRNLKYGTVTHPRWVGVWNSGRVVEATVPDVADNEGEKVIQRTRDGFLMDSRFANNADWATQRATKDASATTKRLVTWLVSGNEALPATAATALNPYSPIDRSGRDTVLLGTGVFGPLFNSNDASSDQLGARVRRVPISDTAGQAVGGYAYWVSDEGVKARANLADKFEGVAPSLSALNDGGMFRLTQPQRFDFSGVKSPTDASGAVELSQYGKLALSRRAVGGWASAASFDAMALIDPSLAAELLRAHYFNDIGFVSAGVSADVVNGGLRKDLTAFINVTSDIPDTAGVPGSGMAASSPLLNQPSLAIVGPRLGVIRSWWNTGPAGTDDINASVNVMPPDSVAKSYNDIRHSRWSASTGATLSLGIPAYANSTAVAPLSPVLTSFDHHYTVAYRLQSGTTYDNLFLFYPKVTLWNPYGVTIKSSQDLRVAMLTSVMPRYNTYLAYYSLRPVRWYNLGKVTLQPGQAISYIPEAGQDFSKSTSVAIHGDVKMLPGLPSNNAYYVDRATDLYGGLNFSMSPSPAVTNLGYWSSSMIETGDVWGGGNMFVAENASYDEGARGGPLQQVFLVLGAGTQPAVLQQVNLDSWSPMLVTDTTYGTLRIAELSSFSQTTQNLDSIAKSAAVGPFETIHQGYRFTRLDDDLETGDINPNTGKPLLRYLASNPFVNFNFRATRFTRHPFDGAHLTRHNNDYAFAGLTSQRTYSFNDAGAWPAKAENATPYLSANLAGNTTRMALVDVPRRALGLHSLGQLQHAPLLQMPWAPGFPVGNSFLPLADQDTNMEMAKRTGYSLAEENGIWNKVNVTSQFKNYIREFSGGTMPWAGTRSLNTQRTLVDWSYELNHALWDTYMTSGIPDANAGWRGNAWDLMSTSGTSVVGNSRFVSAGLAAPVSSDVGAAPYRVAATLMQAGAFNVNSTSVVAWQALLSSFRGLNVPALDGSTTPSASTPYSRMVAPLTGAPKSADDLHYAKETWGGYRALTDAEIQTLAQKIVTQVKLRGPFLSLGDFVNRRLIPITSADESDWTTRESAHLGVLQAAINDAALNKSLEADTSSPLHLERSTNDTAPVRITTAAPKPQTRVKDKLTGAPGYLMQSDLLQKIGPVLSARSDTFTIRAKGESDDGSTAYVELVVQRMPQPLIAGTGAVLSVNPKAISDTTSPHLGNQLFGRRVSVVSMRWLSSSEI